MVGEALDNIKKIKEYAKLENVPIMQDDGIEFLTTFIIKNQVKTVLEIGTAIGYSAIKMALSSSNLKIVSIERDEKRYLEAVKNIKKMQLEDRITLIFKDALDVKLEDKFDLIFIDAAKSQYLKFFNKFSPNLTKKGYIITDNIKFHGLTFSDKTKLSRNLRGLITKLETYISFLENNKDFKARFFDIGDFTFISTGKDRNE